MESNSKLRCELRGNDGGPIYFSNHRPSHLHFLLFSEAEETKVFQEWNSWGYDARTFWATDSIKPVETATARVVYQFRRQPGAWLKNAPTTHSLKKGEFLITDIYLCDGTWRISPKLPPEKAAKLRLVGRFEHKADNDAATAGVWTGQIESPPVDLFLEKECVERLNSDPRIRGQTQ